MKIIRIWLYKITREELKSPDCKPSNTNKLVTRDVFGKFKYYDIQDGVRESSRREANNWIAQTGNKVETLRGYPSWMHDLGYRI